MELASFRPALVRGLPLYAFLLGYIGLTLVGNIGEQGTGFWLLLLLPLILAPVAFLVSALARIPAEMIARQIPEIPRWVYVLVTGFLYLYAIKHLADAHAFARFLTGDDWAQAVRNRFDLLSDLGTRPLIVLKSLLVFLSVYAAARSAAEQNWFWSICTIINVVLLTACLALLNMKWPAVLFILMLSASTFVFSKRYAIVKACVVAAIGVAVYLALATILLRLTPADPATQGQSTVASTAESTPASSRVDAQIIANTVATTTATASTAAKSSPALLRFAISRMAVAAPYYYNFETFAPQCPQSMQRLRVSRDVKCEPTYLVYQQIFPNDEFSGRGSSPAATNLYGYALAGWPGAIVSTLLAMTTLGLFMSLRNLIVRPIIGAIFVMGAYVGYFFSQLPFEGAIIYDNGALWWVLLVLAITMLWHLFVTGRVLSFLKRETDSLVIAAIILSVSLGSIALSVYYPYPLLWLAGE